MMQAKIEAVNKLLVEGEPENISVDEHSGYTGYRPQFIIDAMNEVFWGEWGFSEVGSEIIPGDKGALAVSQVQVWLKDIEFKPTSWGQNRVTRGDIGDARKGAQTDAIKKALSYFSIGNKAYQGLLKEDGKSGTHSQHNGTASKQAEPVAVRDKQSLAVQKMLATARNRVASIGKEWNAVKAEAKLAEVADETLSVQQIATINGVITRYERKAS